MENNDEKFEKLEKQIGTLKFVVLIMAAALIYNSAMKTGMFGDYRITANTLAVKKIILNQTYYPHAVHTILINLINMCWIIESACCVVAKRANVCCKYCFHSAYIVIVQHIGHSLLVGGL